MVQQSCIWNRVVRVPNHPSATEVMGKEVIISETVLHVAKWNALIWGGRGASHGRDEGWEAPTKGMVSVVRILRF